MTEEAEPAPLDEEFAGRDSYEDALLEYAQSLPEPNKHVEWRPVAIAIRRRYDNGPPLEHPLKWAPFGALRQSTFTEVFGDGWEVRVPGARRTAKVRAAAKEATRRSIAAEAALPGSDGAGVASTLEAEGARVGPDGATVDSTVDAGGAARAGALARILHPYHSPGGDGEEWASEAAGAGVGALRDSPVVEVLSQRVADIRSMFANEADQSETTSVLNDRVAEMCEELDQEGVTDEAIVVSAKTESWARRVFLEYRATAEVGQLMQVWAAGQLQSGVPFDDGPEEGEPHMLALARIAGWTRGRTLQECRMLQEYHANLPKVGTQTDPSRASSTPERGGAHAQLISNSAQGSVRATPPRDGAAVDSTVDAGTRQPRSPRSHWKRISWNL